MTNRDWVAENRRDLIGYKLALYDNEIRRCYGLNCGKCKFGEHLKGCKTALEEWLDEEYEEYHILTKEELKKLPIDTKVETKTLFDGWIKRYYDHYDEELDSGLCFIDGCTSWSSEGFSHRWDEIRIRKEYYENIM